MKFKFVFEINDTFVLKCKYDFIISSIRSISVGLFK